MYTIRTNSHHAHRTFEIGGGREGERDQVREEREGRERDEGYTSEVRVRIIKIAQLLVFKNEKPADCNI